MLGEHAAEGVFRQHRLDGFVPEHVAVIAINTDQMSPQVLLVAHVIGIHAITRPAGNEHAMADHDGAGRAGPRQLAFPFQILRVAPLDRNRLRVGANAAAVCPMKARPITGRDRDGTESKDGQTQRDSACSFCVSELVHDFSPRGFKR